MRFGPFDPTPDYQPDFNPEEAERAAKEKLEIEHLVAIADAGGRLTEEQRRIVAAAARREAFVEKLMSTAPTTR